MNERDSLVVRSSSSSPDESNLKRPKVVRLIARLVVSGTARQVCLLHERLASSMDTHLVVGSLAEGEENMSYLLSSEHNVLRLPRMSREVSLVSDALAFWRILRFFRQERPDIVHTHTAKAGAIGRLAAWLAGVPIIVHTYHGHVFHGYFGALATRFYLAVERILGRLSTRIIAISDSQRQELCRVYRVVPWEKTSIINNGFELEHFSSGCREQARKELGIGPDDFVVAWAGRMVPVKDVQLLAQVIRLAADKRRKICFLVIGDGTERPELESLIQGCANTRLLGWRKDMDLIWRAANVALLTSRNEGTPTSLIEAMAAGLPFVATHVGGVSDLAVGPLCELPDDMGIQAANGLLTPRTPEALLYGIDRMADDPQSARQMAAVGKAFALDRFSSDRLVQEMNLLYQTLLAEKRTCPTAVRRSENAI